MTRGKSEHLQTTCRVEHAGTRFRKGWVTESVTENRPPVVSARMRIRQRLWVRVKRRGKSPPPGGQPAGHEKPHVVQDKTGGERRLARSVQSGPSPGISRILPWQDFRSFEQAVGMREMAVTSPLAGEHRIRLTAIRCTFAIRRRMKFLPLR